VKTSSRKFLNTYYVCRFNNTDIFGWFEQNARVATDSFTFVCVFSLCACVAIFGRIMSRSSRSVDPHIGSTRQTGRSKLCASCTVPLDGQSDVATPSCGCHSYCYGCLFKSMYTALPDLLKCITCNGAISTWDRNHRDMSKGTPQKGLHDTLGSLPEIQSKLNLHPSASKYQSLRQKSREGSINLQLSWQSRHWSTPSVAGVIMDEKTGKHLQKKRLKPVSNFHLHVLMIFVRSQGQSRC
jgi:hypothetical protein